MNEITFFKNYEGNYEASINYIVQETMIISIHWNK